MFETCVDLWVQYRDMRESVTDIPEISRAAVVIHGLRRMDIALEAVAEAGATLLALRHQGRPWELRTDTFFWILEEAALNAEGFYYCGHRVRTVVRTMPGLKSFEATGVRNVRNKLIEHPDHADIDLGIGATRFDPHVGDLRLASANGHQFSDAGLLTNAKEFRDAFEAALRTALTP